eukprot:6002852-Prymnesium_polylepis.6
MSLSAVTANDSTRLFLVGTDHARRAGAASLGRLRRAGGAELTMLIARFRLEASWRAPLASRTGCRRLKAHLTTTRVVCEWYTVGTTRGNTIKTSDGRVAEPQLYGKAALCWHQETEL